MELLENQSHKAEFAVYIYLTSSPRTGFDPRSILKQSKTGLNSKLFCTETGCCISLPNYLLVDGREDLFIHLF